MSAADVLALRLALCDNGYTPLPLYGKVPPTYGKNNKVKGFDRWQELRNVNQSQCLMWGRVWPDAENTGILTRDTPAFDLDILNEDAAVAAEEFVKERALERGEFLVRIGLPPKRAFLFQTDIAFNKITANLIAPNGKAGEKIEFLCNGQQLVVSGIHPDTGKPYNWFGGDPWHTKHEYLPYISEEEAQQLVNDVVELLVRDFGYKRAAERPKRARGKSKANGGLNEQLANEQDWQHLIDNILKGHELHDSLRDLAAKYAASGMGGGAMVNALRALMEASTAPHDERWQNRFDDIPRLVDSALDKYAPEEVIPAIAPPPIQPPPPPGVGPQQPAQSGPQPGHAVEDVIKVFRKWLLLDDWTPAYAMLGTIAANILPGDPVWLGLIAPPSSAKTELLNSLLNIPNIPIKQASTLTPAALLSGTPRQQQSATAKGGLLRQIKAFGFLILKDFGSVIDMRADDRSVLLAAFREIYDGKWTRHVGADGGKELHWEGKLGLLFGATPEIDNFGNVFSKMGHRSLFCRLNPCDEQFEAALNHIGVGTSQMRKEMADAVAWLFSLPLQTPKMMSDDEKNELKPTVLLALRLRGPVDRDSRNREFLGIQGAEGPSRLTLTLERLLAGLDALGVDRQIAMGIVKRVAMDSVPPIRRRVYEALDTTNDQDTVGVAKAVDTPTTTARRALEELVGYKLARRTSGGSGKADLWRKN